MQRLVRLALVLSLGALSTTSCRTPEVVHDGVEVVILQGHMHTRYCGHYQHEESWYYVREHKHAVNCGHYNVQGVWQKQKK